MPIGSYLKESTLAECTILYLQIKITATISLQSLSLGHSTVRLGIASCAS